MTKRILAAGLLLLAAMSSTASADQSARESDHAAAIQALLAESVEAWNRGDLAGFIETYWKSPDLRFASGGTVHRGWEATLERYRQRYGSDRESMGRLAFTDIEITELAPDAAVVFGRYYLVRRGTPAEGLFTLTVRKLDAGWRIVQDHTSTARNE